METNFKFPIFLMLLITGVFQHYMANWTLIPAKKSLGTEVRGRLS